ncbi:NosD domain-containing protein [uncultured Amnibacterium sp.]|uniref:NosD domain-containing protein n=1 Tax=uncultured Amnibacterium sp. TaxID=1631851 RepID=UPI0035CC158B
MPADGSAVVLLSGEGIDPTGASDSRAAVQALLDQAPLGATIVNPSGAVLRLNGGITVDKPHTRLTGSGEWRFRSGGSYSTDSDKQNGFIDVRGDHCSVDGIYATNPDGVLNRGVIFLANYGRATNTTLIGFGAGIHVSPAGEFHDFTISGNHVLDIIGNGGGPKDTSQIGESYGDGIMCWGSGVSITGNLVTCKDGADARIGIHVEGLNDQAAKPWVHDHQMAVISGNVVHGRFRRGIVSEGVDHVAITGNTIADSTWWSIALISADHSVVANNVILYTRTAADTQGSSWGPPRSAITLYCVAKQSILNPLVVDNTIRVLPSGVASAAVHILGNDPGVQAVVGGRIAGNRIQGDGRLETGIRADQSIADCEIDDNRIQGFSAAGVSLQNHDGAKIRRNTIAGPGLSGSATAIHVQGGRRLTCDGNVLSAVGTGVLATAQRVRTTITGNAIEDVGTGVDAEGSSGVVLCSHNTFVGVTTPRVNLQSGAVVTGNVE